MCRPEKSCHRDSRYCPWPPWRSFLGFFLQKVKWTHTCHRWSSPPQWHQALLTRPTEVPTALQGKKGTRTLAKAERTQRWSCCNYFNLNLAMARAVNDTPLLGKKVLQGHFNDHKDLSCALKLKVATSRATGPRSVGLGWAQMPVAWALLDLEFPEVICHQAGRTSHRNVPSFCEPGSFGWKCHLPSILFQHKETSLKALCFYKEEDQTFIKFPGMPVALRALSSLIFLWLDSFPFSTLAFCSPWTFYLFASHFLCVNFYILHDIHYRMK